MINNISAIAECVKCTQLKCIYTAERRSRISDDSFSFDLYTSEFIRCKDLNRMQINSLIEPNVCFTDNGYLNIRLDDVLLNDDIMNISKKFDSIYETSEIVLDEEDENFFIFYGLNKIIGDKKNFGEYKEEILPYSDDVRELAVLASYCEFLLKKDGFEKACLALAKKWYKYDSSIIMKEVPLYVYKACGYIFYEFTKGVRS